MHVTRHSTVIFSRSCNKIRCLIHFLFLAAQLRGVSAKCDLDIPPRPKQERPLRVLKREWVSHQLVSEVAAILLEDAPRLRFKDVYVYIYIYIKIVVP